MPHALIPDGFTLKKVTKSEERAIKDKRRHDNVQALLNNPTTVPIATLGIISLGAGAIIDKFIDELPAGNYQNAKDKALSFTTGQLLLDLNLGAATAGFELGTDIGANINKFVKGLVNRDK